MALIAISLETLIMMNNSSSLFISSLLLNISSRDTLLPSNWRLPVPWNWQEVHLLQYKWTILRHSLEKSVLSSLAKTSDLSKIITDAWDKEGTLGLWQKLMTKLELEMRTETWDKTTEAWSREGKMRDTRKTWDIRKFDTDSECWYKKRRLEIDLKAWDRKRSLRWRRELYIKRRKR